MGSRIPRPSGIGSAWTSIGSARPSAGLSGRCTNSPAVFGPHSSLSTPRNGRTIVRDIGRAARAKRKGADRLKPGYSRLLDVAEDLLERARQLLRSLTFRVEATV